MNLRRISATLAAIAVSIAVPGLAYADATNSAPDPGLAPSAHCALTADPSSLQPGQPCGRTVVSPPRQFGAAAVDDEAGASESNVPVLAATGASTASYVALGVVLIGGGVAVVAVTKRRRNRN